MKCLFALASGAVDLVVGPVSITAERARHARFSQPYFQSSLSILSRTEGLSLWQRVAPFFNAAFYYAVGVLLFVLTLVGTLVWLAERRAPGAQFPHQPVQGIANGIWFAAVTMSTVGYGDLAPKTRLGRTVTGVWIIISVIEDIGHIDGGATHRKNGCRAREFSRRGICAPLWRSSARRRIAAEWIRPVEAAGGRCSGV